MNNSTFIQKIADFVNNQYSETLLKMQVKIPQLKKPEEKEEYIEDVMEGIYDQVNEINAQLNFIDDKEERSEMSKKISDMNQVYNFIYTHYFKQFETPN